MSPREFINAIVERYAREQVEELERQAKALLAMGYTIDELTIVQYDDGHKEIHPKDRGDK